MADADNLQATQEAYGEFGRGDIPAVLNRLTNDVEWITHGPTEIPLYGTQRGKGAVGEWFGVLGQELEFHAFEPHDFIAQEDKVAALVHSEVTVRRTGRRVTNELAHVFTYRDGKIARFEEFEDTAAVVAAYRGE